MPMGGGQPRGVEERIRWMIENEPGKAGQCAFWTWHSLGGDRGSPPRWGARNANAVVAKTRNAGDLHTDRQPPRGAIVLWTSGRHGHMALAQGDGTIMSTDPESRWGTTGTMDFSYPEDKWGQTWAGWSTRYNGVELPMDKLGGPFVTGRIFANRLGFGEPANGDDSSDTVRELQERLNRTRIPGAPALVVTGRYDDPTDLAVRLWQEQFCHDQPDGPGTSYLGLRQAARMFPSPTYALQRNGLPTVAATMPADPSVLVRARIVDAGVILFSRRDLPVVTIAELALIADVSRGTITRHFETQELLRRAVADRRSEIAERARARSRGARGGPEDSEPGDSPQ